MQVGDCPFTTHLIIAGLWNAQDTARGIDEHRYATTFRVAISMKMT
jgi:hypothetical protein